MSKEIFSSNGDIRKNAYINWRTHENDDINNLHVLAEGYGKATKILIQQTLEDNSDKKADSLIFPILYGLNQAIELYEKCITLQVHTLLGQKYIIPINHDINQLFGEMKSVISKKESSTKGLTKHLSPLEKYISELYTYIKVNQGKPDIDFSRYPIRVDGSSHFYIESKDNVTVDMEALQKSIDAIFESLEGLFSMYRDESEELANIKMDNT